MEITFSMEISTHNEPSTVQIMNRQQKCTKNGHMGRRYK